MSPRLIKSFIGTSLAIIIAFILISSYRNPQQSDALPTLAGMPTSVPTAVADNTSNTSIEEATIANNEQTWVLATTLPDQVITGDILLVTNRPNLDSTQASLVILPTPAQVAIIEQSIVSEPVSGQIVVQFAPSASEAERIAYIQAIGGEVIQSVAVLDMVVIHLENQEDVTLPDAPSIVVNSEPDYYVTALMNIPPNDPYYEQQWALSVIGAPKAWLALAEDAPKVTVAVIDSGVCLDHPDLGGRILSNGYDFIEDDKIPQDELGHGCGVAGIIAANIDNGIGVAGVAPNAMILPVRVLDANGIGTYSDVAAGIVYAVDEGAQIINLSLGGVNPSNVLNDAIDYAVAHDVEVVAAAGNTGAEVLYPAAYKPVIAVGSLDPDLQMSSFSSRGDEIDVWAPGRDILVLSPNNTYVFQNGTSFAAPNLTGQKVLEIVDIFEKVKVTPTKESMSEATAEPPVVLDELTTLTGWINIVHGDAPPDTGIPPVLEVLLVNDSGQSLATLDIGFSEAKPFDKQYVQVTGLRTSSSASTQSENIVIDIHDIQILNGRADATLNGSKPYINLLCKFSDIASEPHAPSAYGALFANTEPGLDHYWRQISYNNIDISGTTTLSQWVTLPHPRSYYVDDTDTYGANLDKLATDCASAADSLVNFLPYTGINFMFNGALDCCGWGGSHTLRIDGQTKSYNSTWLPPWAQSYGVVAHEMGHSFGLPHSSGPADNPPSELNVYISQWDVMSDSGGTCLHDDISFGCWAPGTIAYHIDLDSWIPSNRKVKVGANSQQTVTLERLNQPVSTTNPLLVIVPINGSDSHYYTVEARFNNAGYDRNIPGSAVIIHEVLEDRRYSTNAGDALVVDEDDGNDNVNDAGAMWTVGETYTDGNNGISITVDSSGATSFTVTINVGEPVPAANDDFDNAHVITAIPFIHSLGTGAATTDADDPLSACGLNNGKTVWFTYTPLSNQSISMNTLNSNYDTVLSVWTGTRADLVEQACNDDSGSPQSIVSFEMTAGTTYYILVAGYDGDSGSLTLKVVEDFANDDFYNTQAIASLPYTHSMSTGAATIAGDDPQSACGSSDGHTVWFSYTPASAQFVSINTLNSNYDTVLSVWTGTRANLDEQACNDDTGSTQSLVSFEMTAGTTYHILVAGYEGDSGSLTLDVDEVSPIANDAFDNAQAISSLPFTHSMSTESATIAGDDPQSTCGSSNNPSVWFTYTPLSNQSISIDTLDSDYDTVLSVWTGERGSLVEISCNDDAADSGQSQLTIAMTSGTSYYILVAGYGGDSGSLVLNVFADSIIDPDVPVLTSPVCGSDTSNSAPVFIWQSVNDATHYEIQLDTVSPPIAKFTTSTPQFTAPNVLLPVSYYWRVRAGDNNGGASAWSEICSINITSTTNAAPSQNYATTSTPTLSWNHVTDATEYDLEVAASPSFADPLSFATTIPANTLYVVPTSLDNGTYYWRVRANNGTSVGSWSAVQSIIVNSP